MGWIILTLILFGGLTVLLLSGLPIGFSLSFFAFISLIFLAGFDTAVNSLVLIFYSTTKSVILTTVPMFVLMGELMFYTIVGEGIFDAASKWLSRVPGGLANTTIATCALFGTVSGSSASAAAAIGLFAIPEMLKRGYDKRLATGVVAAAGGLAHLIPPSIMMVIYSGITDTSVARLFMGGFLPGILLTILMMGYVILRAKIDPTIAPATVGVAWKERLQALRGVLPAVCLAGLVLGTIFAGVATPTEAASVGAFGTLVLLVINRQFKWNNVKNALLATTRITCFILLIVCSGTLYGHLLTSLEIPQRLMASVSGLSTSPIAIMLIIQAMYIVLGMFLDGASMIIITVPIVFPIVTAIGFDPVWFGVSLMINIELAIITPPVGINLFVVQGISPPGVTLDDILHGALPFCIVDAILIVLMVFFPQVILFLPDKVLG